METQNEKYFQQKQRQGINKPSKMKRELMGLNKSYMQNVSSRRSLTKNRRNICVSLCNYPELITQAHDRLDKINNQCCLFQLVDDGNQTDCSLNNKITLQIPTRIGEEFQTIIPQFTGSHYISTNSNRKKLQLLQSRKLNYQPFPTNLPQTKLRQVLNKPPTDQQTFKILKSYSPHSQQVSLNLYLQIYKQYSQLKPQPQQKRPNRRIKPC